MAADDLTRVLAERWPAPAAVARELRATTPGPAARRPASTNQRNTTQMTPNTNGAAPKPGYRSVQATHQQAAERPVSVRHGHSTPAHRQNAAGGVR